MRLKIAQIMKASEDHLLKILSYILPDEIFDYFEIVSTADTASGIHLYLEEHNQTPAEYKNETLHSKGFHKESIIQDFPLRNKSLYLHVRRRRWQIENTGEIVSRDWELVAHGTRYSAEFAAFLKGLLGYLPNQW